MPRFFVDGDPMFASIFFANLGSIGMDAPRHHLYEYGNIPLFCAVGTARDASIVVDGVIYVTTAWSKVYAVDARSGRTLWQFDPKVPGPNAAKNCCDVVNRGAAVYRGKVFVATFDGRLVALDAKDGKPAWSVATFDPDSMQAISGAPRVGAGLVFIGNSGGEFGGRGFVSAYKADTGELAWRFYTVPGDPSKPFESKELEKAAPTWKGGNWWEIGGGGTVWDSMAFDPELDTLYVGTGNGSPWNQKMRSPGGGDNLYLSSILALDPDTGEIQWHYQTTPGDTWDFTATQPIILADLKIGGQQRKVLMQAPKNGFFYVLDAKTGELLSADPYVADVNWAKGVEDTTLCGKPWDRLNPQTGDYCGECIALYQKLRPGWPLPGSSR